MKAHTMRKLRQLHQYLGLFFAPMILLFALSGALQTFRLQEARDAAVTPPAWIVWMASVHKDSSLPHPPKPKESAPDHAGSLPNERKLGALSVATHSTLPSKIFAVLLSIALSLSTLLGVTIALNNRATRRISILLLVVGTVVPLAFLYL